MNAGIVSLAALLVSALTGLSFVIAPLPDPDRIPAAVYESTETPETTPEAPRNSAPQPLGRDETATPAPIAPGDCQAFVGLAWTLGWPQEELDTLERIMRRESACQPDAIGDKAAGGSFGLMQVHIPTWCLPSKYWPQGWLAVHGSVGPDDCDALLDPATNLAAALLIQREGGWPQWSTWP